MYPAIALTAGYFVLSLAIGFFNKWALGTRWRGGAGFTFPFFYSTMHMLCSFVVVSIIYLVRPSLCTVSRAQFKTHWSSLTVLALLYTISVSCNNASLQTTSLSVKYLITGVTPLPTMALSYVMEKKGYTWPFVGVVSLQVLGALLAVPWDGGAATAYGVLLSVLSVFASAGKPVLSGILMRERHETGLTPLALVWYYTAIATCFMSILTLVSYDERSYLYIELRSQVWRSCVAIIVGSLLAAAYNILMFYLTLVTSALTNTMLGNVKQVVIIIITFASAGQFNAPVVFIGAISVFIVTSMYGYMLTTTKSWWWRQAFPSGSDGLLDGHKGLKGAGEGSKLLDGQAEQSCCIVC